MGYVIALAGKGGTGKTTTAALLVRSIKEKKLGSILAVDADPNSNLAETLGVAGDESIGKIIDTIAQHPEAIPSGMPKDRFIEYEIQKAVCEADGFDVLSMGKPEGPGCYCYVNNVLRGAIAKLIGQYDYCIIDNEAGLEHLSRRTTRKADVLIVVSDATLVGLKAARRISELVNELRIEIKKSFLLINCYNKEIEKQKLKGLQLEYLGHMPVDAEIEKLSLKGDSLMALSNKAVSLLALRGMGERIWQRN